MPIAGVGRVEPMDPVVKREVMRRARESGTFATEPDAAWVGSPLPASVRTCATHVCAKSRRMRFVKERTILPSSLEISLRQVEKIAPSQEHFLP